MWSMWLGNNPLGFPKAPAAGKCWFRREAGQARMFGYLVQTGERMVLLATWMEEKEV